MMTSTSNSQLLISEIALLMVVSILNLLRFVVSTAGIQRNSTARTIREREALKRAWIRRSDPAPGIGPMTDSAGRMRIRQSGDSRG